MSGTIIPTPAYKALDWSVFVTQVEYQRRGFIRLSLTNYDNSSLPQIAVGSLVEIEGSLFSFAANDSITGTPSTGTNYIMLEVSGSGASQTVEGVWTDTPPTWSDSRQGWYDATGTKRYVAMCEYDGASAYTEKRVLGGWRRKVREDHIGDDGTIEIVSADCDLKNVVTRYWMLGTEDGSDTDGCILVPTSTKMYFAVNLPHGAIVTQLYVVWFSSGVNEHAYLYRSAYTGISLEEMAYIANGSGYDDSISYATINNSTYKYCLKFFQTTGSNQYIRGAKITYTIDKVYMA